MVNLPTAGTKFGFYNMSHKNSTALNMYVMKQRQYNPDFFSG